MPGCDLLVINQFCFELPQRIGRNSNQLLEVFHTLFFSVQLEMCANTWPTFPFLRKKVSGAKVLCAMVICDTETDTKSGFYKICEALISHCF